MGITPNRIIDSRHPGVTSGLSDWALFRCTFRGGDEFRSQYLQMFSNREDRADFQLRRSITPVPAFAKAAINDIRNSVFQRMRDILRRGGSESYQHAVAGLDLGVDRRGSTMNAFVGIKLLTDLLVMGRVGCYVDAPVLAVQPTLADSQGARPYLYNYSIEDILNWSSSKADEPSEFQSVLLRDTVMQYDQMTMLPTLTTQRYRLLWIDQTTRFVMLQFYNLAGEMVDANGSPATSPTQLELRRIPFVMLDIGDSLLKDVAYHQIALLNLGSSDINYALKANFPFLVEQRDLRAVGGHIKQAANAEGTATSGGQGAADTDQKVGVVHGRAYGKDLNAPAFINPSSEPLTASLALQEKLENDIRRLINLAVTNLGIKASADSKQMDNQGLEAGLSYIGLILEGAERQIAEHWAAYEHREISKRQVPVIKYPDRYSLKTDSDRIGEAEKLSKLMFAVPGRTVKREIGKLIVTALLGGKVDVATIETVEHEIDGASYTTSDPQVIIDAVNAGLAGNKVGSMALGFDENEHLQAQKDHLERILRIAEAQSSVKGDPASRGVPDLSADPKAGSDEKTLSRNTDMHASTAPRVRGEGKE